MSATEAGGLDLDDRALAWQIAEGSSTAHVVDTSKPRRSRGDRGWKSGPRALCGRYPQRHHQPWFEAGVDEWTPREIRATIVGYNSKQCGDCRAALDGTA